MSDSGFSGLPPGPRTGDISLPQSLIELKAKIIELRGELKVLVTRAKLEGEILRHNPDGTTVIRTDKGEITVRLPPREQLPPGTKVELEIPPGNPPRQLIVRPAPEQPSPVQGQPSPSPVQSPRTQQTQPQPPQEQPAQTTGRPTPAPRIDARTTAELAQQLVRPVSPDQAAPVTLKAEDIIRLLPLPPQQVQDILRPLPDIRRTQATPLPQQPQISLPASAYENISRLLSFPAVEPLMLLHDLPAHMPVFTQASQEPFAGFLIPPVALPSVMAATQLIQIILHTSQQVAASPFSPPLPAPVLIMPASVLSGAEESVKLPLHKLTSLPLAMPQPAGFTPETQAFTVQDTPFIKSIPSGSPFDVRIQGIAPPQVTLLEIGADKAAKPTLPHLPSIAVPPVQSGQAGSLTGEVTGTIPQNIPVLTFFTPGVTEPQHFALQFPAANLQPGTQVQIMPLPGATPLPAAALPPFIPYEFFSSAGWPALEELTQTLQQTAPQLAQALSNMSANAATPARVPAAALFFIAAIRSGDIGNWLGDKTVDALRRVGKGDLLARLGRDTGGLQRTEAQPAGEWRATALPMMWDGQMHKMMLYYRHDGKNDNQEDDNRRGTRFIFDLSLNRMGAVQLDGLHRPGRLDLIVRTKSGLSELMQQKMRRTYIEALKQSGLAGELSFQNKPGQFVKVETPRKAAGATV